MVQRHYTKMYAGIQSLKTQKKEGDELLLGMNSREGEYITFEKTISINEDPQINVWLSKVDEQMRNTLAKTLDNSIKQI